MRDDTSYRPSVHALLKDGTTVRIRAVEPGGHDRLEGLHAEMSPDKRRLRFFSANSRSAGLATDTVCSRPALRPLLFGTQGGGPVDLEGLEQVLHRLSRMTMDLPQLAEACLYPVLAAPGEVTVRDARTRLLPRRPQDPCLRRLH
ncbi:acetate--CoA ligase family protein [Streptomyces werraensis]